jgi:hypothetical protein
VHDYASVDVSSLLSFGDVDFTPLALAGALEIHGRQMEAHPSHEAKASLALDRSLLKVAGIADTTFAQEEWDRRLDKLMAGLTDSRTRTELDAAVRIILCQRPDDVPWKVIPPILGVVGQTKGDVERAVAHASQVLSLAGASLPHEYSYSSLSLCVIDAVYSIGVRYEDVQAVVRRYCPVFQDPRIQVRRVHRPAGGCAGFPACLM